MKERPIPFKAHEVRATLAGTMTQVRRIVKPQAGAGGYRKSLDSHKPLSWLIHGGGEIACPYGQSGDRLWVRESFRVDPSTMDDMHLRYADGGIRATGPNTGDIPDASLVSYFRLIDKAKKAGRSIAVHSIHMPRWASRITLEITDIRVERLQDISEEDGRAEGIVPIPRSQGPNFWTVHIDGMHLSAPTGVEVYRMLWESINGSGSWDLKPWVWAISFKRVRP